MDIGRIQAVRIQILMMVTLAHVERVGRQILADNKPWIIGFSAPANSQTFSLPDCIIHQSRMLTHHIAAQCDHFPRNCRQKIRQEFFEILLADETDACRIFFLRCRQACFFSNAAHFRLFDSAQRKHRFG